jgi:cytochrome c553
MMRQYHRRGAWLPATALAALMVSGACAAPEEIASDHAAKMAKGRDLFTKHVRTLLVENCVKCHGGEKTRSGLDLTTREQLLKGGDKGTVLVPGKASASRLYKMVAHLEEPFMPPKEPKLKKESLDHLAAWIDLGAPYDKPLIEKTIAKKPLVVSDEDRRFWSFAPLQKVEVPAVKEKDWCRTPIDRFILAKLEAKGLTPSKPADRRTLLRRAYFDVIGLPPTPDEVATFINDRSPDAYEKMIDRLLGNPHYGERWARHWLDLARFAESHGYEQDYDRPHAYPYRDFVIKAFNQDLPYDKFVAWQLAGDEMEPDNPLALTATGFLGAGVHSTQITANQVEKERYDELDDIVRTMGTAMLGVTIGCARCHDHKYDPIPTKDYYRLLSTFTKTVRTEQDINLDPEGYGLARAKYDAEHAKLLEPLVRYEKEDLTAKLDDWLLKRPKSPPRPGWIVANVVESKSQGGATFKRLPDGSLLAEGKNPDQDTVTLVVHTQLKGIQTVRLEALAHPSLVHGGPGRAANGNFALSDFRLTAAPLKGGKAVPVKLVGARATFEQKSLPVKAAIDDDPLSAWAVDPQFGKDHAAAFDLEKPIGFDGGTILTITLQFKNNKGHGIGRPRLCLSTQIKSEPKEAAINETLATAFDRLDADDHYLPTKDERAALVAWFAAGDARWKEMRKKLDDHERTAPKPQTLKAMICSEGLPAVRLHTQGGDFLEATHFLNRGDPNQKTGVATQGFLQVLMRNKDEEKHWIVRPPQGWRTTYQRRSLAAWMTDVDHGAGHLLARVIVNRLWQHHMGRGIVGTPSDFGMQGERPTHPELLDHLAGQLIENKWRLKSIHKLMMMSAVYRQGNDVDKKKIAADSDNQLYSRRTPRRLEAEVIRDSLLAVSGTLDRKMYGPGTLDPNMKRRSIYFFQKRSQLIPSMVLFDAPDALGGIEQRVTTTIAPQALLMMNNKQVRECASVFAQRLDDDKSLDDGVRRAYSLALGRAPGDVELADSVAFIKEQQQSYKEDGKPDARQLALTDFCQVLLELNEFIYVD